jgi:hypothetical protein
MWGIASPTNVIHLVERGEQICRQVKMQTLCRKAPEVVVMADEHLGRNVAKMFPFEILCEIRP